MSKDGQTHIEYVWTECTLSKGGQDTQKHNESGGSSLSKGVHETHKVGWKEHTLSIGGQNTH